MNQANKYGARVVVLGGGPDAEREVSLTSAKFVAEALRASGKWDVRAVTIERLTQGELAAIEGDVIFPVLHGMWGEGGPLQELLEADGRPFVFSGARASRLAMDKMATKLAALAAGVPTSIAHVLDLRDSTCPLDFPVIVKPVHEGSTIGLYVVNTRAEWDTALAVIREEAERAAGGARALHRTYMVEPKIGGKAGARELTVGLIDGGALPIIEIVPAAGLYDYEAKYHRNDTTYILDPELPAGMDARIKETAETLGRTIGVRHVARADFMVDSGGGIWMLEINTIPGFTDHSLVPKAASHAGIAMPDLCSMLVKAAMRDAATKHH